MDTTVERLKVGTQVIIGSYGVNNDEPHPVVWLKVVQTAILSPSAPWIIFALMHRKELETAGAILAIPTIVCLIFIHT